MVQRLKLLICALWVLPPLLLFALPPVEVNARIAPPPQKRAATTVDFKKEVEPILSARCYACHAGAKALAGLRLDSREAALKGGVSGPSIVPGKGGDSLLVRRLVGHVDGPRMPFKQPPLAPAQIALIRRWIDQGAEWPEATATTKGKAHWAYVTPAAAPAAVV